jgi:hypothetical protein
VLTIVLYALLAIVVMAVVFFVVSSLLPAGEQIAPPIRDELLWELPAGRQIAAEDVAAVRLPVALRGYRFAETDVLLDRLAEELRSRDELIAQLRGERPAPQAQPEPDTEPDQLDGDEPHAG